MSCLLLNRPLHCHSSSAPANADEATTNPLQLHPADCTKQQQTSSQPAQHQWRELQQHDLQEQQQQQHVLEVKDHHLEKLQYAVAAAAAPSPLQLPPSFQSEFLYRRWYRSTVNLSSFFPAADH